MGKIWSTYLLNAPYVVSKFDDRGLGSDYSLFCSLLLHLSKKTQYILTLVKNVYIPIKFIYSEKATKFCENVTVDLSYEVTVKSTVEISQNFVAFSEYMNFIGM